MKPSHHRVLATALLGFLASGCVDSTIDFHICGDLVVPDDIDAVRLVVLDQELEELHAGVRDLADEEEAEEVEED